MASPSSLNYTTLDVFTTQKYAGNPLAVVQLRSETTLTQAQKQTIAREFNYSETVFLHLPPSTPTSTNKGGDDNDNNSIPEWRIDIFTTEEELPFAGHPTIGTAVHCLRSLAPTSGGVAKGRFIIKAGTLELEYKDGVARAGIPHNVHLHTTHDLSGAKVLALQTGLREYLATAAGGVEEEGPNGVGVQVDVVSPVKGMNFGFVEVPDLDALAAVGTTGVRAAARLDVGWDFGPLFLMFYVRMSDTGAEGGEVVRFRTRMIEGSFEDPATGSASVGLAALVALKEKREGWTRFEMVQAVEMGRRSEIGVEVRVEGGAVKEAVLVGSAVEVMEGRVFYE